MPIDDTVFRVDYEVMFELMHPLGCVLEKDGILRCEYTWMAARAKAGFLDRLVKYAGEQGKTIWFQTGDPYRGSKPFEILWIGIEHTSDLKVPTVVVLFVRGKKTDRIEKKWTGKLSVIFGYPVNIIWEENAQ